MVKTKGNTEKETVTFKYDPLGRRIGKQLTTVIDGTTKTSSWSYVYDNDNIALEIFTGPTGTTEKTWYTHGVGTDEHLALERGGQFYYYHADKLGNITAITDQNKAVVQTYEYDSFGMVKPSTNFRNSYTYTGREWDRETGQYYYRARYYDPMEGRFINKDPIGFDGGDVNLYAYVGNNVTNYTDPTGLSGSKPGGPYHPPSDVSFGCKKSDSCAAIKAKIWILERMLYSHIGWDLLVAAPRGGDRHAKEIADLFRALSNCEKINKNNCDDDCGKPPKPPIPPIVPVLPPVFAF
jgi:RHS repeat-associated protein